MAHLAQVRIDARLIHGQAVAEWLKRTNAKHIIIIDDQIASDPFMSQIFLMATPSGCKLQTLTADQAVENWKKDQFGSIGLVFVLMRNIPTAHDVYMKGFDFPKMLIGGIGSEPGRINVHGSITLSAPEANMLEEISDKGCEVVFQSMPDEALGHWAEIKANYYPNI